MLIIKYNTFIFILMFYSIIPQNDICNYDNDCICKICGEDTYNYKTCDYINLFCEDGGNIFTSKYSTFKNNYINYFSKERDSEIFCGEQKTAIKGDKNETTIIKTGQSYSNGTRVHCHFNVYYNDYKKYNPIMTYELIQNGNNKLKFNLIVVYHNSNGDFTELFSDYEIRKRPYEDNVSAFAHVELFLDFKENNYSHIDETFSVKVKLNLKEGETEESTNSNSEDDSIFGTTLGSTIGGVLGLIIIGGIICYCCSGEKTYEVKEKKSCVIF